MFLKTKNNMAKKLKEFKYYFAEKLKDPEYAIAYLNEALADEDKRVFLVALKNVIAAYEKNKSSILLLRFFILPTMNRI